jgi:hypothetical protein
MTMQIPTKEPTYIQSGITVQWQKNFTNYSYTDGYTVRYYTINGVNGSATVTGSYADGVWTFTLTASNNTLPAGKYKLVSYVEKGSGASLERYSEYSALLDVTTGTSTATATDLRSTLQQQLDAVDEAITNYLSDDVPVEEITIDGKSYRRPSLQALYNFKLRLVRAIKKEQQAENIRNGRKAGGMILADLGNGH